MGKNLVQSSRTYFIKLGGSLITDKSKPQTPRINVLRGLAAEIAEFRNQQPDTRLLIGHGSGSFGRVPAKNFGTRKGVKTHQEWVGFAEVWRQANLLNRIVIDALLEAHLPVISIPPSACVMANDGKLSAWDTSQIQAALNSHLLPVIHGDVIFDSVIGGTILSTEDLFIYLAQQFKPSRLFLAGIEPGVWLDFPRRQQIIPEITHESIDLIASGLSGSASTDVTGGMLDKVVQSLALTQDVPGLRVVIFAADKPGMLLRALNGEKFGTEIHS